jgi:hypothetical protein
MSFLVETRSADQCRSHHQKMLKYHGSISDIIARFKESGGDCGGVRELGDNKKIEKRTEVEEEPLTSGQLFAIARRENAFRI